MPYSALNSADIQAGKPTKEELFTTIKNNQDYFDTEITALQQTSQVDIMDFVVSGSIEQYTTSQINDRMPVYKAPVGAQMTSFVLTLLEASSSGTLSVNLDKSTDDGVSWTPLLSSDLALTGTAAGSLSGTVNWVDTPSQSFSQNDLIRIRVTGVKTTQGNFHVSLYGEVI